MESLSATQILDVLCEQLEPMREFFGPTFEHEETHWCVADARLTAFRHAQMWAVAFEIVGYSRGDEFENRVFLCGSHLAETDPVSGDLNREVLTAPDAWNTYFGEGVWGVSAERFAVRRGGKRWDFAPKLDEWERHGILLSSGEKAGQQLAPETMLRFLSEEWDHPFFLSDDSLRALLDEKSLKASWHYDREKNRAFYQFSEGDWVEEWDEPPIPSLVLEKVLQTRKWRHPKVGHADVENDEWEISPREAFGVLSEILAGADVSLWETQDAALFNSDWRLYTESAGVLEKQLEQNRAAEEAYLRDYIQKLPPEARLEVVRGLREMVADSVRDMQNLWEQTAPLGGVSFVSIAFGEGENGSPSFEFGISPHSGDILEKLEREIEGSEL